jgi:hypothetical protein
MCGRFQHKACPFISLLYWNGKCNGKYKSKKYIESKLDLFFPEAQESCASLYIREEKMPYKRGSLARQDLINHTHKRTIT